MRVLRFEAAQKSRAYPRSLRAAGAPSFEVFKPPAALKELSPVPLRLYPKHERVENLIPLGNDRGTRTVFVAGNEHRMIPDTHVTRHIALFEGQIESGAEPGIEPGNGSDLSGGERVAWASATLDAEVRRTLFGQAPIARIEELADAPAPLHPEVRWKRIIRRQTSTAIEVAK
jgi:hypothetical protein